MAYLVYRLAGLKIIGLFLWCAVASPELDAVLTHRVAQSELCEMLRIAADEGSPGQK